MNASAAVGKPQMHRDFTRPVLALYFWLALVIGLTLSGSGIRGLNGFPLAHASLIWIAGTGIILCALAAAGLALIEEPRARRHALALFGVGHVILGLMTWMQWGIYWSDQGLPQWVALAPLGAGIALVLPALYLVQQPGGAASAQRLRTRYDEQIRQIARREERARLARDLHDAVKQQLFVIQTAAATAQERFDADATGARAALSQVRTAAREATTEMEALLDELQAAPLEKIGLVAALKKQCEALQFRTGAEVYFNPGTLPPDNRLPPGAHDAIYRVAQESLANVARHARAKHVTVSLASTTTRLQLTVADDGQGFDRQHAKRGMGIDNMQARASELGGRVTVDTTPPGTSVTLSVPLVVSSVRNPGAYAMGAALLVLSWSIMYGLRGDADIGAGWPMLALAGLYVVISLVVVYNRQRRQVAR